jgi:hypothetical protein
MQNANTQAILTQAKDFEGYRIPGRYTWGAYTVRKHSKRNTWVVWLEKDESEWQVLEANTLRECREYLGTK